MWGSVPENGPRHGTALRHQGPACFDLSFQPALDRNRIKSLAELQFIDRAESLHLIG
jgi:hypothetical protein